MEYAVALALVTERELTEDEVFAFDGTATTGAPGGTRLDVMFVVDADNLAEAAARAIERMRNHIAHGTIVSANAMTSDENDRRIERERPVKMIGITEIAEMLGVSKQRVFQLMERDDFPDPFVVLACGSIWRKGDLSTFADGWRRQPGRPRRADIESTGAAKASP